MRMRIEDCLSTVDSQRIQDIGVGFEDNEGGFLAQVTEQSFESFQPTYDELIRDDALFPFKRPNSDIINAYLEYVRIQYLEKYRRNKVSASMSQYLWSSEEDYERIEFRSPVPGFPPPGQLKVVSSNKKRKRPGGGEYCLAACDDGTVKWLPESECINGNHVWTVHFFDLRVGGSVYLRDRLLRPEPHVRNHYAIKTYIGGNRNYGPGSQTIGAVNCRQL